MSGQSFDGSLLAEFYYKIGWDRSDFQKGAKQNEQDVKNFEDKMSAFVSRIKGFGSDFLASFSSPILGAFAAGKIIDSAKAVAGYAHEMSVLSENTHESIRDVVAWSDAIEATGGSADSFKETLTSLDKQIDQISIGRSPEFLLYLNRLGISAYDSKHQLKGVLEILPSLSDVFQKLGRVRSIELGQKMGLDMGTIKLLLRGRQEIEKIIKTQVKLGSVSLEQAQKADRYYDALGRIQHQFRTLGLSVAGELLPAMTGMQTGLSGVISFINKNHGMVSNFLKILGLIGAYKGGKIALNILGAKKIGMAGAAAKGGIYAALYAAYSTLIDDWDTRQRGSKKNMVTELNETGHTWLASLLQTAETIAAMFGHPFDVFKMWWDKVHTNWNKITWEGVKNIPNVPWDSLVGKRAAKIMRIPENTSLRDWWWGELHPKPNKLDEYFHPYYKIAGAFAAPYSSTTNQTTNNAKNPTVNISGIYINAGPASGLDASAINSNDLGASIAKTLIDLDDGIKI